MELEQIKKEIKFLKERLILLDKAMDWIDTTEVDTDTKKEVHILVHNNIDEWLYKKFISVADMRDLIMENIERPISSYRFNRILEGYCSSVNVQVTFDKSKRISDKIVKGYEFILARKT